VEAVHSGEYISLVVRLQATAEGTWYLHVDGTDRQQDLPLKPLTLVIRLWRSSDRRLLRGVVQIDGNDHWVPLQSNAQLEELVRAWLLGGTTPTED
jgi:hypothetical protein